MQAQLKKESKIPPETAKDALLDFFLPLMLMIVFSFALVLLPLPLLAALLFLACLIGLVIALTHNHKP